MENKGVILEVKSITKRFPGTVALKKVSLLLEKGKIYGLVGENGAGKSTLVKILMGFLQPDEGEIIIKGKRVRVRSTHEARHNYKIAAVFQEPTIIPELSVAENIFLDRLKMFRKGGLIDWGLLRNEARAMLNTIGLDIDVDMKAKDLPLYDVRFVELARELSYDPDILILDEITAVFDSSRVKKLFSILKELKKRGKTIIFISHRLSEVLEICDEIIVLKDGVLQGVIHNDFSNVLALRKKIIRLMTGFEVELTFPEKTGLTRKGKLVLEVKGLSNKWLKEINLKLHKHEIVALAGLRGQGQDILLRTLYGIIPKRKGEIYLEGRKIEIRTPLDAAKFGIFFISDNRDLENLWLSLDVHMNISLPSTTSRAFRGIISLKRDREAVSKIISNLKIKIASLSQQIMYLSGGNKQKALIGRFLLMKPKIILADEPTKGLDVRTKAEMYKILRELAQKGIPSLVILTELPEVLNLPDRILVMREGRIVREFAKKNISEEELLDSYYG
ncbi:MAG: D-xylose ABC transporter ATP-binding protein [Desulfurococcales archaeon ex4484_42]|nr:MAG: D-xylose ABC transporter ATP-binding protein [Desulfurococcales archaeon ex4484_42]